MRASALVTPLVSGTTYRRGVHLLLGAVILLPYVLLTVAFVGLLTAGSVPRPTTLLILAVTVVIGAAPAFLDGTRALEIAAARFLLDADLPEPPPARSAPLAPEARVRAALWFALHLASGAAVAAVLLIAVPMALAVMGPSLGLPAETADGLRLGPLDPDDRWWWTVVGVVLLLGTVYAVAGLGALAALMAPVLLGPSQAERIAALEAGSRRLAERNRLARDLHDSVGHALTATTLQAAAARELFDTDPQFARRALTAIEETGRTAMDDLDYVLGVLRERDRAPQPQRTLLDLDLLRNDAVDLALHVTGALDRVPAAVSREGYRIVQEGLTNAARHAGRVPVTLRVAVSDGALDVELTNPLTRRVTVATRTGRGLAGIRERVGLLGGDLSVGPAGDTWRVAVRLPFGADART